MAVEKRARVLSQLRVVESRFIDVMAAYYDNMLLVFGRRTRYGITTKQVAAAASAVVEGLAQRVHVNERLIKQRVTLVGIDGAPRAWHIASVGFLSVIETLTEPIPDSDYDLENAFTLVSQLGDSLQST